MALYLGIYLILPVCLCQMLAAFGVFVHESAETISETSVGLLHEQGSFPCHCEDPVCKTADIPQDGDDAERTTPDEFQPALTTASTRISAWANQTHSRAPPPLEIACSNIAAFFCVFLI